MIYKSLIFITIFTFATNALAQSCPKTVVQQGTAAPCTGYLTAPEVMEEMTKLPKQIDLLNQKLQLKDEQLNLKDEKIKIYIDSGVSKDDTIVKMQQALIDKERNEALKIGLSVGITAVVVAALSIGLAFAFSGALKVEVKQ